MVGGGESERNAGRAPHTILTKTPPKTPHQTHTHTTHATRRGRYYEDLTTEDAVAIIETLKKGGKPRPGSQHRSKAEPAGAIAGDKWVPAAGTGTLSGTPPGPYCRDLDAA